MSRQNEPFVIRPAIEATNLEMLRPVLESAIQHPLTKEVLYDEVESVLTSVKECVEGSSRRSYLLAETRSGIILGMMGLQVPGETMRAFASSANPAEIINAYVSASQRGRGIGSALLRGMEQTAKDEGYSELIVNSGPRYQLSGWPFWQRMYGEPVALAEDYYGPRFHAAVWRKSLKEVTK